MKKYLFKNLFYKTKMRILKSYLSVNYSTKRFEFKDSDKCLCLAPHQDDETIGMGGTLARYPKNFEIICLTNGAKGFKHKDYNEAIEIRKQEFQSAMELIQVKNKILDIEDRALIDGFKTFSTMDIRNYDYIFVPNIIDQHKDHKATSVLLYKLLKISEYKKDLKIGFYEVWSPLSIATNAIDISAQIEIKRKMLEKYKSQCEQRSYYEASIGLAQYRGLGNKTLYAEAFWIMKVDEFIEIVTDTYTLLS